MIYFLRHGQTDWNILKKCQGRVDIPLNATGKKQAKEAAKLLEGLKIDKYFCSPLVRARQTFELAVKKPPTPDEIDERVTERDLGEFEGLTPDQFDFSDFCNAFSTTKYKKAESVASVKARSKDLLNEINTKYKDKNILIVSHDGFKIIFECVINGDPEDGSYLHAQLSNCAIAEIDNTKYKG